MTRIGNFFKKIGRGIKKGAKAAYNFGKKVVKKVVEYAPKVFDTARKVANVLPSNKYTDGAKTIIDKSEEGYRKAHDIGKKVIDTGKKVVDVVRGGG